MLEEISSSVVRFVVARSGTNRLPTVPKHCCPIVCLLGQCEDDRPMAEGQYDVCTRSWHALYLIWRDAALRTVGRVGQSTVELQGNNTTYFAPHCEVLWSTDEDEDEDEAMSWHRVKLRVSSNVDFVVRVRSSGVTVRVLAV